MFIRLSLAETSSSVDTKPSSGNQTKAILIIAVVIGVILFLPIIPQNFNVVETQTKTETYTESEPYTETQIVTAQQPVTSQTIFNIPMVDTTVSVQNGQYTYYQYPVDLTDKSNNAIQGTMTDTAGYGINFLIFDQQGFTAWYSNHNNGSPYVKLTNSKGSSFNFVPTHTDTYYFVLDNTYSWFSNKLPHLVVNWSGVQTVTIMQDVQQQQTVTKYRDVQKTRTVDVPVTVTKVRYVNVIQLMLGK